MPALHDARRPRYTADDRALLARAKEGEDAAFAELWSRHYDFAVRSARSITAAFDPEDLASEALARIFERLRSGGGPTSEFRPYLFVSVRNLATEWARSQREFTTSDETLFEKLEATATPEQPHDEDSTLVQAFRSLPPRWREALWYTEVDGMTTSEAAEALALTPNAVHQLTFRAREGLRVAWIQASLPRLTSAPACQWTVERMGAYERDRLGSRDRAKLERHVRGCVSCTRMVELAEREGARLRAILVPLLLAGGLGAGVGLAEPQSASADTTSTTSTSTTTTTSTSTTTTTSTSTNTGTTASTRHVGVGRRRRTALRRSVVVAVVTVSALLLPWTGAPSQAAPVAGDARDQAALFDHSVVEAAPPALDPAPVIPSASAATEAAGTASSVAEEQAPASPGPTPAAPTPAPAPQPDDDAAAPAPVTAPPYTAAFGTSLRYDRQLEKFAIPLALTRSPGADPTTPVTLFFSALDYYSFAGIDGYSGTVDVVPSDAGWTVTLSGATSDADTLSVLLRPEMSTWPEPEMRGDMFCYPLRESIRLSAQILGADGQTTSTASFYDPGVGGCEI